MTRAFPYRAVLFDVDGTLMDSNGAHAEAWTQAFTEHGIEANVTDVRPLIGMGGDKLLPAIAHVEESSPLGEALAKRKKEIFKAALPGLRPTNGARSLLELLRDRDIDRVVATSAGIARCGRFSSREASRTCFQRTPRKTMPKSPSRIRTS